MIEMTKDGNVVGAHKDNVAWLESNGWVRADALAKDKKPEQNQELANQDDSEEE